MHSSRLWIALVLVALTCQRAMAGEVAEWPLLFMHPSDVRDVSGNLSYEANPLQDLGKIRRGRVDPADIGTLFTAPESNEGPSPPMRALLAVPHARGGYTIYGTKHEKVDRNYHWTLYRARTADGYHMQDVRPVYESPEGEWLIESMMAQRHDTGELFFYTWTRATREGADGHALWGFRSPDGETWTPLAPQELYHDHDAFGIMWDPRSSRFINCQTTYLAQRKPFPDNMGGERRRVMSIRTSADGVTWDSRPGPAGLIVPDEQDGPDVEFYRMHAFPYYDRYVAMMDKYAATPLMPDKHGPHLACEWWLSSDGIQWERPWRELDARGTAGYPVKMAPMYCGQEMLWWIGDRVWGLPEQRLASIGARANAAFTTRPFIMPAAPLRLNATIPVGQGMFQQAYVMAELLDADGNVIPGYERERCTIKGRDDTRLPLSWAGRSGSELAGREVSLRFYLRDARLYAVTAATEPGRPHYSTSALEPMTVIDNQSNKQYINSMTITQSGAWIVSVTTDQGSGHYTYTRRSEDRGRTWEPRVLAYDAQDVSPEHDAEMGQLLPVPQLMPRIEPEGARSESRTSGDRVHRIYQFHILRDTQAGARFGRLVYSISEDDGRTWFGPDGPNSVYPLESPAYELAPAKDGWHLMAPGIILSTGEFLLPMNISTDPPALADIRSEVVFAISRNVFTEPDPTRISFEFYPPPPHGVKVPLQRDPAVSLAQEPQVVELSDGRLMCVMRTGNGAIYYTVSSDHGRTWREAQALRDRPGGNILLHPNAAVPFTRLSGGRYALLYCNNDGSAFGGRNPFDHTRNRHPIYIAIGRELPPGEDQPMAFTAPRLLCSIQGFRPDIGWRDLTYGFFLENQGEYFHFYNAVWHSIQVNRVDPALTFLD